MSTTLFDLAHDVRQTVEQIDPETGEIVDTLPRELFEKKAAACVAFVLDEQAQIKGAISLLKATSERLKARERRLDRFKSYMLDCMRTAGVDSVDCFGLAGAQLSIGRDVSVELDDGAVFPPDLYCKPVPPLPSKTLIRAAIEKGQDVPGARIVKKDRLWFR